MLENDVTQTPMRDRLPTIPCDLSELARALTGSPDSANDRPLFVEVWPCDVPCVTGRIMDHVANIDHREAYVLALLDGETNVASVLASVAMASTEVMGIIEGLCARGIVRIDHAQRAA